MSADNTVVIQKRLAGWCVWAAMGDDLSLRPGHVPLVFDSELDAFHEAQRWCNEELVEYGIVVLPPQPQEKRETK